jgi:hypothetical protein
MLDNCRNSDCSLVAWIFCLSRYLRFHSRCPGYRDHTAYHAFHEAWNSQRLDRFPALIRVTVPVP